MISIRFSNSIIRRREKRADWQADQRQRPFSAALNFLILSGLVLLWRVLVWRSESDATCSRQAHATYSSFQVYRYFWENQRYCKSMNFYHKNLWYNGLLTFQNKKIIKNYKKGIERYCFFFISML